MNRNRKAIVAVVAATAVAALCLPACAPFGMQGGPPQNDMLVDQAARNEVIESVVTALDRYYVFPDKAAAVDQKLHARLQHGDFDSITSAEKLAATLTDVVQGETRDKHIEVHYFEKAIPEQPQGEDEPAGDRTAELLKEQRLNYGFASVGRLQGNIGYIDLHQFGRPQQQAAERIAAAMTLLSETRALIIDLRKTGGGDPDSVMLFASYLFDKRTHLNDIYWREGDRTEQRWTQDSVAGKRYGESRKLYVLTSSDTFSAGEDFAYAMKNAGRATLIGEITGGGAHPGNPRRLDAHFMMFVPSGRAINPVTHTDWEVVGVMPDIKVSAKDALNVAQIAALKDMIATETDQDWKQRLQDRLNELD